MKYEESCEAPFAPMTFLPGSPLGGLLNLDEVGAKPRQHLSARRASLELREIDYTYPVQRLVHPFPSLSALIERVR